LQKNDYLKNNNTKIEKKQSSSFDESKIYDQNGNLTNNKFYLDTKGRPRYDNEGRMVTYPDEVNRRQFRPSSDAVMIFTPGTNLSGTLSYKKSTNGNLKPVWTPAPGRPNSIIIPMQK